MPSKLDEDGHLREPANQNHPFMRGIMNFDDYNYNAINEFVLVSETSKNVKNKKVGEIGDNGTELSEQNMNEAALSSKRYQHDELLVTELTPTSKKESI